MTPLMCASFQGHYSTLLVLLRHSKIQVNKQDADGCTALMYACAQGHHSCVQALLEHPEMDLTMRDHVSVCTLMDSQQTR